MSTTTTRTLAAASAAALAGTVLAMSPSTTPPAEAATAKILVKSGQERKALRRAIVRKAKTRVGSRYVWGTAGPNTFDCSGLVNWAYRKVGGKNLPRSSYALRPTTKHVGARKRKVGDIVFFNGNGHVAIYAGKNKIVHAANSRRGVRIDKMTGWYRSTLVGYGRVILRK
ncbi:MAG: C40 family peptidase [Candidatus Nanopelagicales bacterium]|nr:C40 family peptidase [Candidatus Nanopelagicales bacterium]